MRTAQGMMFGVVLGIMMFLLSFGVLYWNEGRVDMSRIARKAAIIEPNNLQVNAEFEGQLVSASGTVTAEPEIGDDLYLKPGSYFKVERHVDIYAWVEQSETVTRSSSTDVDSTETEYTYTLEWVDEAADSKDFHEPEGHTNPTPVTKERSNTVSTARLGEYEFIPEVVTLPELPELILTADKVSLTQNAELVGDEYIYVRKSTTGTYAEPQLGDERVSYTVLKVPFEGTLFGQLKGSNIEEYITKGNDTLYRLFPGTHEASLTKMHAEYTGALWGLRVFGFFLMWFGLWALFGPITSVMDLVPVFGAISRAFIGFASFIVAFVLSLVTIVVSAILHNIFAVLIVVGVLIAVGLAVTAAKQAKAPKVT